MVKFVLADACPLSIRTSTGSVISWGAPIVAARAAGGVHSNFARDLAGGGIEADGAAHELEAAVHRVQSGRQCESHVGVRGVRIQDDFLAPCGGRNGQRRQEKLGAHRWKDRSARKMRGSNAMARNAGFRSHVRRSMVSISFDISVG